LEGPAGLEQGDTNMIRFKKDFWTTFPLLTYFHAAN
jgi:hypothetical protein